MHNKEIEINQNIQLEKSLKDASDFLLKNYLNDLTNKEIKPISERIETINQRKNIRVLKIGKIIFNEKEENLEKLQSLYSAVFHQNSTVFIIISGTGEGCELYLGIRDTTPEISISVAKKTLEKSLKGNFPGVDFLNLENSAIENLISEKITHNDLKYFTASAGIPDLKDKENKDKFTQGLEKFIESMHGSTYTALLLAEPINSGEQAYIADGYKKLYSALSPFEKKQLTLGVNDSKALNTSVTETVSKSISDGTSESIGTSNSNSHGETDTKNPGAVVAGVAALIGTAIAPVIGTMIGGAIGGIVGGMLGSHSTSNTKTETKNETNTDTHTETDTNSRSETLGATSTSGTSSSIQLTEQNKMISVLLEKIDKQLERIDAAGSLGMWNFSAYFISDNYESSRIAANSYNSIMRGEHSGIENSTVISWNDTPKQISLLKEYLSRFCHPVIENVDEGPLSNITVTSSITTTEIALALGFPRNSVSGLPVTSSASFGREVYNIDNNTVSKKSISIGNVFHLGNKENQRVNINLKNLCGHVFVTGATGSGKSNTVYSLLEESRIKGVNFLVIEPAKGEYKNVFGGKKDVNVFGTNPRLTPLLRINPFIFPNEIHVLEHIDRLIEIFNACWPMYAAMPAVLKKAIENIYVKQGWDLENSINIKDEKAYPSFTNLLHELPKVISSSAYSEEVKSNYIGALVTRIESLVNGINGLIFSQREIDNEILFDKNCIIDLSRIGSSETRSLLMGLIFMKLHEHRMTSNLMNQDLKHLTVIEEAHNLLRQTSSTQSEEGANLQGKSVEMISNAIAEMRTYGEGFIIADQAPGLLDQSVIRNTNIKIIHRLPDQNDKTLVGKSAFLKDEQIEEISRFKTGVAAIYQNDWLEPVLTQIDFFDDVSPFSYQVDIRKKMKNDKEKMSNLLCFLLQYRIPDEERMDIKNLDFDELFNWLKSQRISLKNLKIIANSINAYHKKIAIPIWDDKNYSSIAEIVGELINTNRLFLNTNKNDITNLNDWTQNMKTELRQVLNIPQEYEMELIKTIIREKTIHEVSFNDFYFSWVEEVRKGVIL